MSTDKFFYKWILNFPNAALTLAGIKTTPTNYHALSVTLKEIELRLDCVLIPDDPDLPRVPIEFHGYKEERFFYRYGASCSLYCYQENYRGALLPIVIFIEASFAHGLPPAVFQYEGAETLSFHPRVIILESLPLESILSTGQVDLIPLLPLMLPETVIEPP